MRWSYRLFRVRGISVELHLTFIAFLALILAVSGLQGFLLMFLIFTVVLAHELMHSFTAILHGINVPRIILTPIGGLASVELPDDPLVELKVSIVGPLFNFMLAAFCLVLLLALDPGLADVGALRTLASSGGIGMGSLTGILLILVSFNMTLGVFNMLPAFPMDGGRVFRSVLALWIDYGQATRIASLVGQAVLLVFAVYYLYAYDSIMGFIIAFFLSYAGTSEVRYVGLRRLFEGVRLADIASPSFGYVNGSLSWGDFLSTVYRPSRRIYIVTDSAGAVRRVFDFSEVVDVDPAKPVGASRGLGYAVLDGNLNVPAALKTLVSSRLVLVAVDGKLIGYVTPETLADSAAFYNLSRRLPNP